MFGTLRFSVLPGTARRGDRREDFRV